MISRLASGATAFVKRVFPERQIYHRADGQVQYLAISTRVQVLAATVSALALGWTAYSTASVVLRGHLLSEQSAETGRIRDKYDRWLAEARAREASALQLLQTRTSDFESSAREFERRHVVLKELLEHATEGRSSGRGIRVALQERAGDAVMMTAAVEDPTPRRSRLSLASAQARSDRENLRGNDRLAAVMAEQDRMLEVAEETSQDRVENLRAVLALTDAPVDEILSSGSAQGGPFNGVSEAEAYGNALELEDEFARRVLRVAARVSEAERLERAIDATPLDVPVQVAEARLTSPFGRRVDPINGRPAMHYGQDFAAYRLAPITAAAPGRVTFVGWRGGYGKTVEIDHGHGFKTRYAHLQTTSVRRGDQVGFGDKIGGMGSTGRSTGTHLHYEVWFNGKAMDPANFLKAGRYVQQG